MRASDLDLRQLLEFAPDGGVLRFAGERAVLLDAAALGLLRKQLIGTLGPAAARGVLTRFGYAHGWRTAEALRTAFPWASEREWRIAGGRLHRLQGLVVFEPVEAAAGGPFAEALWRDSYEAEQHLLQLGRADETVCWTLCGFASGYLSRCHGREIYCCESQCRGRGDPVCRMIGDERSRWGPEYAAQIAAYEADCLDEDLRRVTRRLARAERRLRVREEALARADARELAPGVVGRSEALRRVVELARRVAEVDATVLVTGESGVGKEVVARLIHDRSPRAGGPFVAVNCGAIGETLLESELFGHARGAFTGAVQARVGLFEAAHGGTLLLDEIGEVSPAMQVKLLRVLQRREVRRVGEQEHRAVDVRVIAATHRDLAAEVAAGRFREDLRYRLDVVGIHVPPLRERPDDILPLARAALLAAAGRARRPAPALAPEVAELLLRHRWPGNVRELENAMERAVALARGPQVVAADLPDAVRVAAPGPGSPTGEVRPLAEVEREAILAALAVHGGNRTRTAKALQIGAATLYRKLGQYARERPKRRARSK
jgi:DNA-binding NtrC family response regulator